MSAFFLACAMPPSPYNLVMHHCCLFIRVCVRVPHLGDAIHGGWLHHGDVGRALARRAGPKHGDRRRRVHLQAVLRRQLQHILQCAVASPLKCDSMHIGPYNRTSHAYQPSCKEYQIQCTYLSSTHKIEHGISRSCQVFCTETCTSTIRMQIYVPECQPC